MAVDKKTLDAIETYVETAAYLFHTSHRIGMKLGLSDIAATDFAREMLRSFTSPIREKTDLNLAGLMERLTPGGSA